MATAVQVPQFGNTVEQCIVTRWFTRKGSSVSAGDVIAEIETDKTTFEINAPVDGTVLETFYEEGAVVPVFANLCVIGTEGESAETSGSRAGLPPPIANVSPRARRLAELHGIDSAAITGSGPNGRVIERDVRVLYDRADRRRPATPGARATIARRLRESLASTAQYTMHAAATATGLLAFRAQLKSTAVDININHLVSYCTVRALRDVPALNAEYIDGQIVEHAEVHLGFACDTAKGLLVPVIRDAHTLTLTQLADRMKTLGAKATDGRLAPDDLSGGTFTISNLGAFGIEAFTPVLNPPQVAILGVGAIHLRPVRVDQRIDFVDAIALSLTCDHQVIDGAPGAKFLAAVREKIDNVEALCRNQLS